MLFLPTTIDHQTLPNSNKQDSKIPNTNIYPTPKYHIMTHYIIGITEPYSSAPINIYAFYDKPVCIVGDIPTVEISGKQLAEISSFKWNVCGKNLIH